MNVKLRDLAEQIADGQPNSQEGVVPPGSAGA
jgi:hypothetical protein